MDRVPLDELCLLNAIYCFRDLTKEEQNRISISKFEYEPSPEYILARMTFEYENEQGVKTSLSYALASKRSEDDFYEHVIYEENGEDIEFPDFKNAIDFCNQKGNIAYP